MCQLHDGPSVLLELHRIGLRMCQVEVIVLGGELRVDTDLAVKTSRREAQLGTTPLSGIHFLQIDSAWQRKLQSEYLIVSMYAVLGFSQAQHTLTVKRRKIEKYQNLRVDIPLIAKDGFSHPLR